MSRRSYIIAASIVMVPLLITIQMNLLSRVGETHRKTFTTFLSIQMIMVATSVLLLIHYYLYRKIIAYTFVHKDHPKALYLFACIATLSSLSFFFSKLLAAPETSPLAFLAFAFFGWSILTVFSFGTIDLLFLLLHYLPLGPSSILPEVKKSRRKAILALSLSTLLTLSGMMTAGAPPELVKTEVYLEKLPCSLDGFTIVQISDTHLGNTFSRSKFVDVVNRVNDLNPDIVALTGDFIDAKIDPTLLPILEPLGWLNAKYGIFYVTGNHEYIAGSAAEWVDALKERKIHVLHNSHEVIVKGVDSIVIAGVDDVTGTMVKGHGHSLVTALDKVDKTKEIILLAHQPIVVEEAANSDVGFVLTGHTHGGQIWPFGLLVKLAQPYLEGLHTHYSKLNSNTQIYVSRGTGWWGPPIRLFVPAEITHHTLRCKKM